MEFELKIKTNELYDKERDEVNEEYDTYYVPVHENDVCDMLAKFIQEDYFEKVKGHRSEVKSALWKMIMDFDLLYPLAEAYEDRIVEELEEGF